MCEGFQISVHKLVNLLSGSDMTISRSMPFGADWLGGWLIANYVTRSCASMPYGKGKKVVRFENSDLLLFWG